MTRADIAERIADLVGGGLLTITDRQRGWPSLGTLRVEGDAVSATMEVALFVAPVIRSHRNRDDVERRFENPGQNRPIVVPAGRHPLLLGLWEEDRLVTVRKPILVSADPLRREGLVTRYSVFASLGTLQEAEVTGWAEDRSTSGERIRCLYPSLLPVSAMADFSGVGVEPASVKVAVEAAGLDEVETGPELDFAASRARRAVSSLVRDARFSKRVVDAYDRLCAMCGLDLGLVQGAHIYPASAPGSPDEVWNGIALCANHHVAFDRHLIWVNPEDRRVTLHQTVLEQYGSNSVVRTLVDGTFVTLSEPTDPSLRPRPDMFENRYRHYEDRYKWAM